MNHLGYIRVPKTGSGSFENYLLYQQKEYYVCGVNHIPYTILSMHKHVHDYFCFVRDPLQLYSSFYFFMKKRIDDLSLYNNPLKFTEQNQYNINLLQNDVSLEEFLIECPKNQMLSYFIDPLPLEEISFIGTTENMDKSIYLFNKMFGLDVLNKKININTDKNFDKKYLVKNDIEKIFKKRNEREYEIYKKSCEIFNNYI